MCGIIGYTGANKNALNIILNGLEYLEYRGYDSAGVAAITQNRGKNSIFLKKSVGRVSNLSNCLKNAPNSSCAIGHTRWATHGIPTVKNAHPHYDCQKKIFVVHCLNLGITSQGKRNSGTRRPFFQFRHRYGNSGPPHRTASNQTYSA